MSTRGTGPDGLTEDQRRRLAQSRARLRVGFSRKATADMKKVLAAPDAAPAYRIATGAALLEWQFRRAAARTGGRRLDLDIVIVSHLALPGGNTTANAEEIAAYAEAGLRVGLLHHPVFRWDVSRPVNPKIERLVDGERVVMLGAFDRVRCDLMIVRLPTVVLAPLDDRPEIEAARTVVLANQTPFKYYGPDGGVEEAWDLRTAHRNVRDWVGDHTWYTVGPMVRAALDEHHADQLVGVDLAAEHWFECVDARRWELPGPRERSGPIRIGRHSRDHELKWPSTAGELLACYPEGFEIHVLGGADTPRRLLGGLPANWVEHPFGSLGAKEFLGTIDAMVYFIAADGREAFGIAPLEAMAAGVPVVMDRRFEPLFGPAALYCEPDEVAATVRGVVEDPDACARQTAVAKRVVAERFSREALLRRVASLGVRAAA
ncbi:glycosyltransferase [Glycomyces paridis]|uniref:Glycosyltransferase n=1 Tax=Glycomyces paridis TaxID=2126555 RepID=A0A4S8PEJ8_9ACTN|nr:glycosyltransferase [Glycomyces paridis]THV28035.1 glycosyltransferase [Glycomyces paridis]